ncbi:MAG: M20 family peptidase [Burkholderiaceae bacterium]|nr:M20 family peptidase [Burkholderiaceae bacterium]
MKLFKRSILLLLAVVLLLAAALAVVTLRAGSRQLDVAPAPAVAIDSEAVARRLAGAIPFRTMSVADDPSANVAEFDKLHAYMAQQFPRVHAQLQREVVGSHGLLYTWKGRDATAKPVALLAHQDVVPIAPGTESAWQAAPFGGEIRDGFVWGRGAWDNKGNLFAQLEAIEMLLAQGYVPPRTVYLVMGHDEEVSGLRGAKPIAGLLKSRGVQLDWVLDEGLLVMEGILAGLSRPAALVGVAEKGYGTFFLDLDTHPGHSSMPPRETAIGMMSAALTRLEGNQLPAGIRGVAAEMFDTLAPEMSPLNRVMLSNLWLTRPVVQRMLEKSASTNAMLRTTTALTIVNAGNKDNVLPGHASAAVNFRVLPGDSLASVERHVHDTVANDAIKVTQYKGNAEPSPVSPTAAGGYQSINRTIREVFPEAIVAPGLMIAATDSRHFAIVSDNIYRFSPVRTGPEDLGRFHGTNERLSIANYAEMIRFYHRLLGTHLGAAPAP